MTAFVLVPGSWQGGWVFDALAARLRAAGHDVRALTLAGLEPVPDPGVPTPNLDTHIGQVVTALHAAAAPVVLCGHSYGGMVITGAADRAPGLVSRLVYLDAYVPTDGDTCWEVTSDRFRDAVLSGVRDDGRVLTPPPGGDERNRPHPLPTVMQAIRLTGAAAGVPRMFVSGGEWRGSPFVDLAAQLRLDPAWTVRELPVGHDVMNRDPDGVAEILLAG